GRDHLVAPTDLHLPFEDDDELVARAALTCEDAPGLHVDSGGEAPDLPKVLLGEVPEERHAGEELIRRGSGHLCCSRSPSAAGNASQRAGPAPEESPAASSLEGGFRLQCVGQRVACRQRNGLPGSPNVGTNRPRSILETTLQPCGGFWPCAVVQSIPATS